MQNWLNLDSDRLIYGQIENGEIKMKTVKKSTVRMFVTHIHESITIESVTKMQSLHISEPENDAGECEQWKRQGGKIKK